MDDVDIQRRQLLLATGTALTVTLAGCSDDSSGDDESDDDEDSGTGDGDTGEEETGGDGDTGGEEETGGDGDTGGEEETGGDGTDESNGGTDDDSDGDDPDEGGAVPPEVDAYLEDNEANGYDGTLVDRTGADTITIDVGAGENGLAFAPAAVAVDAGTEVTWEWTGEGGRHNVAVNEGPTTFESEIVGDEGFTFTQTLEAGNYRYQCTPHAALGMHGAVVVREDT